MRSCGLLMLEITSRGKPLMNYAREPDATILMVADLVKEKRRRIAVGADKAWRVTQN